jgi:ubiquinone/menaquinone biosynthesis C-methylase UbiE
MAVGQKGLQFGISLRTQCCPREVCPGSRDGHLSGQNDLNCRDCCPRQLRPSGHRRLTLEVTMTGHVQGHAHADASLPARDRLCGWLSERARRAHAGMFGLAHHAAWYDACSGRLARPLYRRIAADVAGAGLPDGAAVLDVGTGPGRLPLLIAERCPKLIVEGLDLSEEMIGRARRGTVEAGIRQERLTYRVGDVAALPYADNSVDLVVSSLSLHHWTDVPAGLAEIRRVMRPGGQAWIYDVGRVLNRVASNAPRHGIDLALEPLVVQSRRSGLARYGAVLAGRLMARLTVTAPTIDKTDPSVPKT